jgi:hypothetical protein
MTSQTKDATVARFKQAFAHRFGRRAEFNHYTIESADDGIETIQVSVPTDNIDWSTVEPDVKALLQSSGASRYFEIGGAGYGFGFRDVSIYRRGTIL